MVGLYFSLRKLSYKVEGCEWVSVESDCQCERDKKQIEEDKCECASALTAGKTADIMISKDKALENGKEKKIMCFCI